MASAPDISMSLYFQYLGVAHKGKGSRNMLAWHNLFVVNQLARVSWKWRRLVYDYSHGGSVAAVYALFAFGARTYKLLLPAARRRHELPMQLRYSAFSDEVFVLAWIVETNGILPDGAWTIRTRWPSIVPDGAWTIRTLATSWRLAFRWMAASFWATVAAKFFQSSTLHQSAVVREIVDSKAHGRGIERMSIDINAYTTANQRWWSYPVVEVRPVLQLNGPQPSTYVAC